MERYDVKSRCPKCDFDVLRTEFHAQSFEEGCAVPLCEYDGQDEHIVRTCIRCEAIFFQKPLELAVAMVVQSSTVILPEEPTELW